MSVDLGDVYALTVETRDAAGALANAGAITLSVGLPDGTTVTSAVTNPSTGRYQVDYLTTMAGRHTVYWVATGANASAYTDVFHVSPADNGALISLAEAKRHLNMDSTSSDEELRSWLGTATEVIRRHTGKEIARTTYTDRLSASGDELWLHHRPVLSLTSITSLDGSVTWPVLATNVDVDGDWGRLTRLSGSSWYGRLKVTYVAGMSVVPDNYTRAARILVEELWNTQRQPGVGPSPTPFDGQGFAPKPAQVDIPPLAKALLGPPGVMVA